MLGRALSGLVVLLVAVACQDARNAPSTTGTPVNGGGSTSTTSSSGASSAGGSLPTGGMGGMLAVGGTGGMGGAGGLGLGGAGGGADAATDFSLLDVNTTSSTFAQPVSPRDHLTKVSGWYFGHAT